MNDIQLIMSPQVFLFVCVRGHIPYPSFLCNFPQAVNAAEQILLTESH